MSERKAPRGIEDILKEQKEAKEAASKPVFISNKKDRAAQALAKRNAQVERQRMKEEAAAEARLELQHQLRANSTVGPDQAANNAKPATSNRPAQPKSGPFAAGASRGSSHMDVDRLPTGPRAQRDSGRQLSSSNPPLPRSNGAMPPPPSMPPPPLPPSNGNGSRSNGKRPHNAFDAPSELISSDYAMPVVDESLLKSRYLGEHQDKKRRTRKQSDKKFVFDWDKSDDTGSGEFDPLYRAKIEGTGRGNNGQLYGRGRMAGFDAAVQVEGDQYNSMQVDGEENLAGPSKVEKKSAARLGALDDRHWTEKPLPDMKERDWRIFREDYSIAARGGQIPHPIRYWRESAIPAQILDVIDEIGYKEPSPIQRQAIPIGLQNRDLIGIAETGSGKTASFLIPMLDYIGRLPPLTDDNRSQGPYALIMAPTRELAQQIESEAIKFTSALGYKTVSIVGGKAIEEQQQQIENGAEIIIATPGRLKDCIERHILVLAQCTYVIMDEADRMVDLGFEQVINYILDALPLSNLKPDTEDAEDPNKMMKEIVGPDGVPQLYRQTVMFSATMPAAVERLAKKYMRRPAVVTIGVAGQAVDTVEQQVEFVSGDDKKKQRLLEILNSEIYAPPIIVFANQKRIVDQVAKDLMRAKWRATTLHSDKNQEQREAALASLRAGEADILVATDLAGRGIDVPDVSLVVNFMMAKDIETYVHRIGRTGRAGKQGTAITFVDGKADEDVLYDLKQEVSKSKLSRAPKELLIHPAAQSRMSREMRRQAAENEGAQV